MDLSKYLDIGKQLGLSGSELRAFCENERKLEAEVRASERDERIRMREFEVEKNKEAVLRESFLREAEIAKSKLEADLVRDKLAAENAEKVAMREAQDRQRQHEDRQRQQELEAQDRQRQQELEAQDRQRQYEIEMKRLELQNVNITNQNRIHDGEGDTRPHRDDRNTMFAKVVPIAKLGEGEQIDMFLTRFDRHADLLNLTGEWRAMSLANCLSGKARNIYDLLDVEQARDCENIKTALLQAFQIDAESCRAKFDNAKLFPNETMCQFYVRLNGLFKRWEDISEIEKSYQGLKNDILKTKIFSVMSPNLIVHLKLQKTKDLQEISNLADEYLKAHQTLKNVAYSNDQNRGAKNLNFNSGRGVNENQTKSQIFRPKGGHENVKQSPFVRQRSFEESDIQRKKSCFLCGSQFHLAAECRNKNLGGSQTTQPRTTVNSSASTTNNSKETGNIPTCTYCVSIGKLGRGHTYSQCFKRLNSVAAIQIVEEGHANHPESIHRNLRRPKNNIVSRPTLNRYNYQRNDMSDISKANQSYQQTNVAQAKDERPTNDFNSTQGEAGGKNPDYFYHK